MGRQKKQQVEIHTTPLRTTSVSVSLFWYTIPGQSIKKILLVMVMYCHTFVSPGIGATLQTYRYINKYQKIPQVPFSVEGLEREGNYSFGA
jgi:hypothetical protein